MINKLPSLSHFQLSKKSIFIVIFAVSGSALLLATRAATPFASLQPEQGTKIAGATSGSDPLSSGGQFVQFGSGTTSGTMPTAENTGPAVNPTQTMTADQFLTSRTCNNKRITETIRMDTNGMAEYAGATLTLTNCVVEQGWIWNEESFSYPLSEYPTINMSYTTINGSFAFGLAFKGTWDHVKATNGWQLAACGGCALTNYGVDREIPFTMTNSYIFTPPIPASTGCGFHSEAFHGIGGGGKYTFINTRFVQDGTGSDPFAYCHTGSIYQQGGSGIVYDGCYFDDGQTSQNTTYFITVNIDGSGGFGQNVVKNSYIEKGGTYATNPAGGTPAIYTNNFDFNTREQITIP